MDNVNFVYFATYDPGHTQCKVWRDGRWLLPSLTHEDFLAVEKSLPDSVEYIGDADEVVATFKNNGNPEYPFVSPTERYGGQIFKLTDAAYLACERRWKDRNGIK